MTDKVAPTFVIYAQVVYTSFVHLTQGQQSALKEYLQPILREEDEIEVAALEK